MAVLRYVYDSFPEKLFGGYINFVLDPIKCALLHDTYSYSSTHANVSDVTAHECADPSYFRQTLTGKSILMDPVAKKTRVLAASPTFPSLTAVGIRYAVFFKSSGVDDTSPLMLMWDLQARYNPTSNDFRLIISDSGLITLGA